MGWNPDYGLTAASVFGAVWFSGYFDYCVQSMALKKMKLKMKGIKIYFMADEQIGEACFLVSISLFSLSLAEIAFGMKRD